MGKGGGGSQGNQTTSTAYNTNIPQYAQPYVENMLGATQKQLFNTRDVAGTPGTRTQTGVDENNNPVYSTTEATPGYTELTGFKQYQPYSANPSDYVAGFSPLQQRGFDSIADMQVAPQIAMGTDWANKGAQGGINSAPIAYNYGAQGSQAGQQGLGIGTTGGLEYGGRATDLAGANIGVGAAGMGAGMGYGQAAQNPNAVRGYMNPYLQASLQPQLQEIQRQYGITGTQQQSDATKAGAFGGSREALMAAENQRNKNIAMNQVIGQGYNNAYNLANQNMQAASQLGMQGAQSGLAGLQGANQSYATGLQGVNTALAGTAQGMQGAQTGLAGVQGAQAGYGLSIQGANALNALANTQYNQEMGIAQAQLGAGAQQQQYQQQIINQGVQDYANAQQYPLMQLGTMSNMLRGLPMQAQTTNQYMAAPNQLTQGIGAAGSLAYMNSAMQPRTAAKGGIMQAFDVGGAVKANLENMSLQQLQQYKSQSASPEAKRMTDELIREKMMEAQLQKQQPQRMAGGGITAVKRFQNSGEVTLVPGRGTGRVDRDTPQSDTVAQFNELERRNLNPNNTNSIPVTTAPPVAEPIPVSAPPVLASAPLPATVSAPPVPAPAPAPAPAEAVVPPVATTPPVVSARQLNNEANPPMGDLERYLKTLPPEIQEAFGPKDTDKSIKDYMKERTADKAELVGENKGLQDYRAKEQARLANIGDEERRQNQMLIAKAFANWGTKPGSTLLAMVSAMKESIPDFIENDKAQRKARSELDKSIYEIDNAVRLEKLGDYDAATKLKEKAADRTEKRYSEIIGFMKGERSNAAQIAAANASAGGRNLAKTQALYTSEGTALTTLAKATGKDIFESPNFLQHQNTLASLPSLPNSPSNQAAIKKAQDQINAAKETYANTMRPYVNRFKSAHIALHDDGGVNFNEDQYLYPKGKPATPRVQFGSL